MGKPSDIADDMLKDAVPGGEAKAFSINASSSANVWRVLRFTRRFPGAGRKTLTAPVICCSWLEDGTPLLLRFMR